MSPHINRSGCLIALTFAGVLTGLAFLSFYLVSGFLVVLAIDQSVGSPDVNVWSILGGGGLTLLLTTLTGLAFLVAFLPLAPPAQAPEGIGPLRLSALSWASIVSALVTAVSIALIWASLGVVRIAGSAGIILVPALLGLPLFVGIGGIMGLIGTLKTQGGQRVIRIIGLGLNGLLALGCVGAQCFLLVSPYLL